MTPARMLGIGLAAASALGLALASCASEEVRTSTLLLDGEDGGALHGFNCIDTASSARLRDCLDECTSSTCIDDCEAETARAKEAGAPPASIVNEHTRCTQLCLVAAKRCNDACLPDSDEAKPLAARANGKELCVAIDFLRVGGETECRSTGALLKRCIEREDRCASITRQVHCVPALEPVPPSGGMEAATPIVDANYARLRDELRKTLPVVATSAPSEWVIVRMLATTAGREALADPTTIDLDTVVGCALSCPLLFENRDRITLALDDGRVTNCRGDSVRACAAIGTDHLDAALAELAGQ